MQRHGVRTEAADLITKSRKPLSIMQFAARTIPFVTALVWQHKRHRSLRLRQLIAQALRHSATLPRFEHRRRQQPVMRMGRTTLNLRGNGLPSDKIHQIVTARSHQLRDTRLTCIGQPVRPRREPAKHVVRNLLWRKIHYRRKSPLTGQAFKGAPPHTGRMKHRHLKASGLQCRFQRHHVTQYRFPKRGHAYQRPLPARRFDSARRPQDRPGGLAQRRLADRVQSKKTA